jgi:hypothetical protein
MCLIHVHLSNLLYICVFVTRIASRHGEALPESGHAEEKIGATAECGIDLPQ